MIQTNRMHYRLNGLSLKRESTLKTIRPSLKDCLFRVTRPLKKDRGRSVGKSFFMAKILNRKNIYFPYISVGLYLVATYQCF